MTITREEVPALYDADVVSSITLALCSFNVHYRLIVGSGWTCLDALVYSLCDLRIASIAYARISVFRWDSSTCHWWEWRTWG